MFFDANKLQTLTKNTVHCRVRLVYNDYIDEIKKQAHDDLFEDIKESRAQVRKLISELQKTVGSDAVRDAMRAVTQVRQSDVSADAILVTSAADGALLH